MPGVGSSQMFGQSTAVGIRSFSPAMSAAGMERFATSASAGHDSSAASVSPAQCAAGRPTNAST